MAECLHVGSRGAVTELLHSSSNERAAVKISPQYIVSRPRAATQQRYLAFSEQSREVASGGKVPIILTTEAPETLAKVKRTLGQVSRSAVERLPLLHGVTTWVGTTQLEKLFAKLPEGTHVSVNHPIVHGPFNNHNFIFQEAADDTSTAGPTETAAVRLPGLDKVWQKGFTGKGQTIAVIDSGIFPHPDLKDRIVGWVDFAEGRKKPVDKYGHGTHVAGIAAGSGGKSQGSIKGVAPEANLVGVRIGSIADAIKALHWVIENKDELGISVVNMSLGDIPAKGWKNDPWAQATQQAIDAGLTVVVSAGNEGPNPGTVNTPGILPAAITVGAVDDNGTLDPSDDKLTRFSSRGPSVDGLIKPDIAAPGKRIFGPLAQASSFDVPNFPRADGGYFAISGTSQATPMVSGLVALLKQANPKLSQADLQAILKQSAYQYSHLDANAVGSGLVQADKALELALNWKSA
jgi:subtilisin family serine protease